MRQKRDHGSRPCGVCQRSQQGPAQDHIAQATEKLPQGEPRQEVRGSPAPGLGVSRQLAQAPAEVSQAPQRHDGSEPMDPVNRGQRTEWQMPAIGSRTQGAQ